MSGGSRQHVAGPHRWHHTAHEIIALSRAQLARCVPTAEVVYQKLHASIILETWRLANSGLLAACGPSGLCGPRIIVPARSSLLCWSALLRRPSRFCSLDCSLFGVRFCLFSAVSRAWFWGLAMSRAESAVWPRSCPRQFGSRGCSGCSSSPGSASGTCGVSRLARTSVPARTPALSPRPLPVVLVAPSCSISVAPRAFSPVALLSARFPLAATPAPWPLPTTLLSHGARLAWLAAPLRVSHEPQPLFPTRPLLGRQVRGVVLRAPLKHGNAGGISIATELDAQSSAQCGLKFCLKALASRAMWACCTDSSSDEDEHNTLVCSLRLLYLRTSASWMSSWWPSLAGSPWTFFTIAQQDRPDPETDHLAHDPGCDLWF